jgi:sarcosine oxidase
MSATAPRVAVVGLGAIGSATLWALAERGVPAVGFEQYGLGHDHGASGGGTRLFRMLYTEGAEYLPLLRRARERWQELERRSGQRLLLPSGALTIGREDAELVCRVLAIAREEALAHELLDGVELARRHPQYLAEDDDVAVLDPAGGLLVTHSALIATALEAKRLGAEVRTWTPVLDVRPRTRGGVSLRLADGGQARFDRVVVTTGPWIRELVPQLPVAGRRHVGTWHAVLSGDFTPEAFPPMMRQSETTFSFGAQPTLDGQSVKFDVVQPVEAVEDPDELDDRADHAYLRMVEEALPHALRGVHPSTIRSGAWVDGYAPDGHPLIGPLPDAPDIIVLAGFSGHGFKLAPAFGELAAALAAGEPGALVPPLLALDRPR